MSRAGGACSWSTGCATWCGRTAVRAARRSGPTSPFAERRSHPGRPGLSPAVRADDKVVELAVFDGVDEVRDEDQCRTVGMAGGAHRDLFGGQRGDLDAVALRAAQTALVPAGVREVGGGHAVGGRVQRSSMMSLMISMDPAGEALMTDRRSIASR